MHGVLSTTNTVVVQSARGLGHRDWPADHGWWSQSPSPLYGLPFDELPNPRQVSAGEPGSEEEGMCKFSLLSPERVANAAASEIKTEDRFTLQRDVSNSHWDGLRHCSQLGPGQEKPVFYSGMTVAEIQDRSGILIDYVSYADRKGINFDSFFPNEVTVLFRCIGITRDWDNRMTIAEKTDYATKPVPELAGVEPTAAVAGDSIAFLEKGGVSSPPSAMAIF
ncbi:hypothetical protein BDV29DRAFT_201797 [Aspergillus leporis]|uniref:Uncharacterized protein n=1 Tax=Aspergillus leporis TaxID=41062 RepID=A0A5N5WYS9_9EURO|nr:hypothetical protein BDV29DRAFT_201797 [Aspergillus leporis]